MQGGKRVKLGNLLVLDVDQTLAVSVAKVAFVRGSRMDLELSDWVGDLVRED